ncbi:hypothetical protein PInf_010938 [Phytophthora infestans]|nr:hypothetical protein PInf_010938 [Phytophthora infestans]
MQGIDKNLLASYLDEYLWRSCGACPGSAKKTTPAKENVEETLSKQRCGRRIRKRGSGFSDKDLASGTRNEAAISTVEKDVTVANVAVLRKDAAVKKDATEKNAAVKNDATMEKDAAMQTDSCEEGLRPRLASSMKTKLARRVRGFNRTPNDAVDARDVNDEGEATQQVVSETENSATQ